MGFKMPSVVAVVGMVCAGVGLIFQIVGVATAGWVTSDDVDAGSGLWEQCLGSTCIDLTLEPDWLEACRAFGILGLLILVGCVVVGVLMCLMQNDKLPLVAAVLGFVAAFCILIEFAVYAGETDLASGTSYGYSFALTIVAFILAIAAGICFIVGKNKPS